MLMNYLNFYSGKTILVTGGAGAIGNNLCKKLGNLRAEKIIILDNLSSAYQWNTPDLDNILFIKGDIRNDDDLRRAFHYKPQIVFHLAAFFANQNSIDYPLVNEEVNGLGLLKVLEYSNISQGVQRFIYTNSQGGAYSKHSKLPHSENDISIDLSTPYYISKLVGEAYCKFYFHNYKLPVSIVRLFNSFGPGEVPGQYRNVIPNFIYWALNGEKLPVTGNSNIARDFVFVKDTIDGILRAGYFQEAINESFNICSGNSISIYQLAEMINEKTGNSAGITLLPQRNWDTRSKIVGNPEKAKEKLNFRCHTDFETGLDITIDWFKDNWKKILESAEFPPGQSSALISSLDTV